MTAPHRSDSIGSHGLNSNRLGRGGRLVLDYLWSTQDEGASIKKVAANLRIPYYDVQHLFSQLLKCGEIFKKGDAYCSTAWAMAFDPKPIAERLKAELERDLFGQELTPRVRAFLTEFSAAAKLGLSVDEGFHFAQRKVAEQVGKG